MELYDDAIEFQQKFKIYKRDYVFPKVESWYRSIPAQVSDIDKHRIFYERYMLHNGDTVLPTDFVYRMCTILPKDALVYNLNFVLCEVLESDSVDEIDGKMKQFVKNSSTSLGMEAFALPNLCGYVFQHGDIAFNCRNCQVDDTCVQCLTCYQKSNHEGHEVYFHRTTPGGMCDCGDVEAWHAAGCCEIHGPNLGVENERATSQEMLSLEEALEELFRKVSGLATMPRVAQIVMKEVVEQLFDYLYDVFGASKQGFSEARLRDNFMLKSNVFVAYAPPFHVRISNDDVHTDDELIVSLTAKGVSEAAAITKKVDAEGSIILNSYELFDVAMAVFTELQVESWLVSIVDNNHIQREENCIMVITWLNSLTVKAPMLNEIMGRKLFRPIDGEPGGLSLFQNMLSLDANLLKEIVVQLHDFYMHLLGDKSLKLIFSAYFVRVYDQIMVQFLQGLGTQMESIFGFGVQIFTTPSIVKQLMHTENLVQMLLKRLEQAFFDCQQYVETKNAQHTLVNSEHVIIKFKRYTFLTRDLGYVLNVTGAASECLKHCDTVQLWLIALRMLQGTHPQTRIPETQPHVEFETHTWIYVFNLHLAVNLLHPSLLRGLKLSSTNRIDSQINDELLQDFRLLLVNELEDFFQVLQTDGDSFCVCTDTFSKRALPSCFLGMTHSFPYVLNNYVSNCPVSMHYPLHHMLGRLILFVLYHSKSKTEAIRRMDIFVGGLSMDSPRGRFLAIGLAEFPLRTLVFNAQIGAGMWTRNGTNNLGSQRINYMWPPLCLDMRDLDITLLQFVCLNMTFDPFLAMFFERFELLSWFFATPLSTIDGEGQNSESDKLIVLAESCLLVFIWMVTELPGLTSPAYDKLVMRREVLHQLCVQPCLHSTLLGKASSLKYSFDRNISTQDNALLKETLDEIAILRPAASNEEVSSKYELRPEFEHEYDPTYFQLSPLQHEQAQARRAERKASANKNHNASPTPIVGPPPAPHAYYENFREILFEAPVVELVRRLLLYRRLGMHNFTSEKLILRALHILTLQLQVLQHLEPNSSASDLTRRRFFQSMSRSNFGIRRLGSLGQMKNMKRSLWDVADAEGARSKVGSPTSGEEADDENTIPGMLYQIVKKNADQSSELHYNISWILEQYARECPVHFQRYAPKTEANSLNEGSDDQERRKKLEMRKEMQRRAMERMQKQQAAFAITISNSNTTTMEVSNAAESLEEQNTVPVCVICSEVTKKPIMKVAFAQRSFLLEKLSQPSSGPFHAPSRSGASLHIQTCDHALHVHCYDEYVSSLVDRTRAYAQLDYTNAANILEGEYLCPFCQTLCNCLLPYDLPYVEKNTASPAGNVLEECNRFLRRPIVLKDEEDKYYLNASIKQGVLNRETLQLVNIGLSGLSSLSIGLDNIKTLEKVHILWSSVACTIKAYELSSMSEIMVPIFYASDEKDKPNGPLHMVGLNFDDIQEEKLLFGNEQQEKRVAAVVLQLNMIYALFETRKEYISTIVEPLQNIYQLKTNSNTTTLSMEVLNTWQSIVKRESLLSFCQPLLSIDTLYLAIALFSTLDSAKEICTAAQTLCVIHAMQVLLRSYVNDDIHAPSNPSAEYLQDELKRSNEIALVVSLRSRLCQSAGVKQRLSLQNDHSLSILLGFESSVNLFLRQMVLLLRLYFKSHQFEVSLPFPVHSLKLSSRFSVLWNQFRLPSLLEIAQDQSFMESMDASCGKLINFAKHDLSISPSLRNAYAKGQWYKLFNIVHENSNEPPVVPLIVDLTTQALVYLPPLPIEMDSIRDCLFYKGAPFIPLPLSYTDLHVLLSRELCPATGKVRESPCICLLCGAIVCAGTDCCKRDGVGACTLHTQQCGYSRGLFFLLRKCTTLIIDRDRSCYCISLYVDQFGEEDANLRRGRPLFLHKKRLIQLIQLYTSHGLANDILRRRRSLDHYIRSNFY